MVSMSKSLLIWVTIGCAVSFYCEMYVVSKCNTVAVHAGNHPTCNSDSGDYLPTNTRP